MNNTSFYIYKSILILIFKHNITNSMFAFQAQAILQHTHSKSSYSYSFQIVLTSIHSKLGVILYIKPFTSATYHLENSQIPDASNVFLPYISSPWPHKHASLPPQTNKHIPPKFILRDSGPAIPPTFAMMVKSVQMWHGVSSSFFTQCPGV
jgi:hypothetical protein